MSAFVSLFLALWAIVGGRFTLVQQTTPVQFTDLYGVARSAPGAASCNDGQAVLYVAAGIDYPTLDHELIHVADCLDDGSLDGSYGPQRGVRPPWMSDYCWDSNAEYEACVAQYDPQGFLDWMHR